MCDSPHDFGKYRTDDFIARSTIALEKLADHFCPTITPPNVNAQGYVWRPDVPILESIDTIQAWSPDVLCGVTQQWQQLWDNTCAFVQSGRGNNVLLWGRRGTGKSSIIKACVKHIHAHHTDTLPNAHLLRLVEVSVSDITTLPALFAHLKQLTHQVHASHNAFLRFILFIDDLSFSKADTSYRILKSVLEGSAASPSMKILVYATSNRRHLVARENTENEKGTALHPHESVDEHVSLSDRFGLWLGFPAMDQPTYLDAVRCYFPEGSLPQEWHKDALSWSLQRGGRSGRVAYQFALHYSWTQKLTMKNSQ